MSETTFYVVICVVAFFVLTVACYAVINALLGKSLLNHDSVTHVCVVMVLAFVMPALIGWAILAGYASGEARDTELLGGVITKKVRDEVHCRHSYDCPPCWQVCNSRDDKGNCTSYRQECSTCYEHPFDVDWDVYSSLGNTWNIDSPDRQGLVEPKRWTVTTVGEPVLQQNTYLNWIKAAKFSLLNKEQTDIEVKKPVPGYPLSIYDLWHSNRFIASGVKVPDEKQWNDDLMVLAGELGPKRQGIPLVLITKEPDPAYGTMVERAWRGGAKNDIAVIIGAPKYPEIAWVYVYAMAESASFKVTLEDQLRDIGVVDRAKITSTIRETTLKKFVRKRMRNFVYLKDEIVPPMSTVWWIMGLGCFWILCVMGGTGYMMYDQERQHASRMKRYR